MSFLQMSTVCVVVMSSVAEEHATLYTAPASDASDDPPKYDPNCQQQQTQSVAEQQSAQYAVAAIPLAVNYPIISPATQTTSSDAVLSADNITYYTTLVPIPWSGLSATYFRLTPGGYLSCTQASSAYSENYLPTIAPFVTEIEFSRSIMRINQSIKQLRPPWWILVMVLALVTSGLVGVIVLELIFYVFVHARRLPVVLHNAVNYENDQLYVNNRSGERHPGALPCYWSLQDRDIVILVPMQSESEAAYVPPQQHTADVVVEMESGAFVGHDMRAMSGRIKNTTE